MSLRRRRRVRGSVVVFGVCLVGFGALAAAPGASCGGGQVWVDSDSTRTREQVCAASIQALAFLQDASLLPRRTIRVRVVEQPLEQLGHPIYGRYDGHADLVEVMSLDAIRAQPEPPEMYGEPFDEVHYRAAVAHELAHAVVQHNRRAHPVSHTAQEYIAHATQLAVVPADRRAAIIRAAGVGSWQRNDVISDVYMAMSPTRFAVKSYLHLTSHPQPQALVARLLAARWRYVNVE